MSLISLHSEQTGGAAPAAAQFVNHFSPGMGIEPNAQVALNSLSITRVNDGADATTGSDTEKRINAGLDDFRDLFPASICYPQIVPVDEVVTLALYFREDEPMQRLMLNDAENEELDRLWDELLYITREPFKVEVAYEQIVEFSTQDRPDLVIAWKPYREPLMKRVAAFRERLEADEPRHLYSVLEFAGRAWRRPLSGEEQEGLRALYRGLREREIPHEKAIQLTIARVLTSPTSGLRLDVQGTPPEQRLERQ